MNDHPWLKHYDPQVPHHLEYPAVPLHCFLEESAKKYPDRPCTIFKGAVLTYRQVDEMSDRLAAGLASLGVKKGEPVGIFMPNIPQFVVAYYAILKLGGIVVATNPTYAPPEIEYQLNDAGVRVVLAMSLFYPKLKAAQPKTGVKKIVVTNLKETLPPLLSFLFTVAKEKKDGHRVTLAEGDLWMKDLIAGFKPQDRPKLDVGPDDACMYQYSGGTTGTPKAAVAMHRNLVANSLQIRSWLFDTREGQEITLMALPLFHVYGMVAGMSFTIRAAGSLVMIPNARDVHDLLVNINRFHPTTFPGAPILYNMINNHPDVQAGKYNLRSIRACISGSAPLMLETKQKFEAITGGKLFEGYGLSEAPTATHCNPMAGVNKEGSIGLPFPDVECRIVSVDDGKTDVPVGEIGELLIRGPQVMQGYLNRPEETAATLTNGWLHTGDIARMDEDGYFYIVDRKKELIKPGGLQVWPREVEEVLKTHPKVLDVGVAGVPDVHRGETVKAWVVLRPGESATEEEMKAWCAGKMAKFKIPTHVEFRTELPKTAIGKLLRRELVREHLQKAGGAKV